MFPRLPLRLPVSVCGAALMAGGMVLFHYFGNATRGYIDTPSLFVWWGRQWFDPRAEAQHGPLILVVAAWLLWRNLRTPDTSTPAAGNSGGSGVPAVALLTGLALHVIGFGAQQTRLSILALLIYLWGVAGLLGGTRWSKATLFPLGFVLLAVPVGFLDSLGFYLRYAVSVSAEGIAGAMGIPVHRSGTQLFSPDGRFQYEVAAACSGIRSLVALFALGVLVGYLRYVRVWARLAFAALTLPFAYLGNLVRILAIVFAGHFRGHEAGERVHAASGLLVFVVVLGLLILVAHVGRGRRKAEGVDETHSTDTEVERTACSANRLSGDPQMRRVDSAGWVTLLVLIATLTAGLLVNRLEDRPAAGRAGLRLEEDGRAPVSLPEFLGTEWIGQRVEVTPVERDLLPPDTGYSRRNYVSMEDRNRQVFLSIVLSGADRSSIHRPELCILGQGWTLENRTGHTFVLAEGTRLPATLLTLRTDVRDPAGQPVTVRTVLAYWFVGADTWVASHPAMIWRSTLNRLSRFQADRWAYVVAQTPLNGDEAAALQAIQEVLEQVWPEVVVRPAGAS